MIVTLCSGSAFGSSAATTAWPDSWYAQVTRSCSVIASDRRSTPISTLSRASSRSVDGDRLPAARTAKQRRLVHEIRQIGAGEAGRAARDLPQVDVGVERDLPAVDPQNLLAALDVRRADRHLAIETAGTQQRRIEDVGTIGRGDDDDALVRARSRPSRRAAD